MCVCVNMCTYIYRYTHTEIHTHTQTHIYSLLPLFSAALMILRNDNSLIAFEPGMWFVLFFLILYFWLSQFIRCVQKLYFLHVVGTLAAQFPAV